MLQYTIRRLLLIIPTMFFVALITFTLAHMAPGSPFDKNENRPMSQETIDRINRTFGLDKPIPEQFAIFLGDAIRLDFGTSLTQRDRSVTEIIGQGLPVTAQLGVQALLLSLAIALPLGVVSALKQNSAIDYGSLFFATIGYTIPSFVLGIVAIFIFAVYLRWLGNHAVELAQN